MQVSCAGKPAEALNPEPPTLNPQQEPRLAPSIPACMWIFEGFCLGFQGFRILGRTPVASKSKQEAVHPLSPCGAEACQCWSQDMASWSRDGVAGLQSVVLYSLPELDGAIDTVPLGGLVGDGIFLSLERVRKLAARIKRWVALRRTTPQVHLLSISSYAGLGHSSPDQLPAQVSCIAVTPLLAPLNL